MLIFANVRHSEMLGVYNAWNRKTIGQKQREYKEKMQPDTNQIQTRTTPETPQDFLG